MKTKEMLNGEVDMLVNRDEKNDPKTVRTVHPDTWDEIYTIWSEPTNSWWDRRAKKNSK